MTTPQMPKREQRFDYMEPIHEWMARIEFWGRAGWAEAERLEAELLRAKRTAKLQADHAGEVEKENLHMEAEITRLETELEAEREAHAQLQSRCYEGFPTGSSVFDEADALRAQLAEREAWSERGIARWTAAEALWSKRETKLLAERDEARAEAAELQAELGPLRETVGVRADAKSHPEDITYWCRLQDKADSADRLRAQVAELAEALEGGVTETLDYISRNNLSGAENNHWIVRASAALAKMPTRQEPK